MFDLTGLGSRALDVIPIIPVNFKSRHLSNEMKHIRTLSASLLLASMLVPLTGGCGGDGGNTVVQPGELTAEQEAEMSALGDQLNESMNRSPTSSGKGN